MPDVPILGMSAGAPAVLTDTFPAQRDSVTNVRLTVQDVLTAITLLTSGAPATLADELGINRAGAKKLTLQNLQDLLQLAAPNPNMLVNGSFAIAQRNITMALANAVAFGSVDRWAFGMGSTAAGAAQQQNIAMPGTAGTNYRLRLVRTAASASLGTLIGYYVMESIDVVPLQGKQVTLSWDAAGGAQFSPTSGTYSIVVTTGTGTDQGLASLIAGTWTGSAQTVNTTKTVVPGNAAVRPSVTFTVPSTATELAIQFSFVPVGTAGADDALYLGRVKQELGSVATPWIARLAQEELDFCQRYYEKSYQQAIAVPTNSSVSPETVPAGAAIATGNVVAQVLYKVRKRAGGTAKTYSFTSSTQSVLSTAGAGTDLAAASASVQNPTERGFQVINSSGGNITPGGGGFIFHWACDAELV